jgi:hypothetical protein
MLAAGAASPALAERVTCDSHRTDVEACTTLLPNSQVRLVQQIGNTPCVEGQNWGIDTQRNSLWISNGCNAVFDVRPPLDDPNSKRHEPR